jgi:YHS domain-containing protein
MVKDLVCGMGVEEDSPETFSMRYHGTRYFFCSADCLLLFSRAPQDYTDHRSEQKSIAKDLVCGMEVDKNNAPFMTGYNGTVYYFCSEACRQEFLHDPNQFVEKS